MPRPTQLRDPKIVSVDLNMKSLSSPISYIPTSPEILSKGFSTTLLSDLPPGSPRTLLSPRIRSSYENDPLLKEQSLFTEEMDDQLSLERDRQRTVVEKRMEEVNYKLEKLSRENENPLPPPLLPNPQLLVSPSPLPLPTVESLESAGNP